MPVTNYIYDGNQYLAEADENDTIDRLYTNEPDAYTHLISQEDVATGDSLYYHYDAVGSTRQVTDDTENVTDEFTYDAWGNRLSRTGASDIPFEYVGEFGYYREEGSALLYVMARVYRPKIHRWLSTDPVIQYSQGLFQREISINEYSYAALMPVARIDPSGLTPEGLTFFAGPLTAPKPRRYPPPPPLPIWPSPKPAFPPPLRAPKPCVPDYPALDPTIDRKDYNCAGLAFRTFDIIANPNTVEFLLLLHGNTIDCQKDCGPCEEKCWFWTYEKEAYQIHKQPLPWFIKVQPWWPEEERGWFPYQFQIPYQFQKLKLPNRNDFHIVCGETGIDGSPPKCISKNGKRSIPRVGGEPITRPGGDWRPPEVEWPVIGEDDERHWNLLLFRLNIVETCYCVDTRKIRDDRGNG